MHADEQTPDHRHAALMCLYERTWEEIQRLREFEWKAAFSSNSKLSACWCHSANGDRNSGH